ncbi:GNAT family N-acetyltransferase [Hymenobacter negativus]|uniref:GNAT family N-acetyltransferase n=1 Tax=Hymenobacter negativus TaxID=2795026 RepID=A0ABS3QN44_9BACT|nr:GNAT family N-acetyltransferase [Hymenobacter negativus]MBO2012204.1 GNAT family N-acetyltransferase [Hymenobacter negativus]
MTPTPSSVAVPAVPPTPNTQAAPVTELLREEPIRRLRLDDLPACLRLAQNRSWPPEEQKWRFLFAAGQVYGLADPAGELAATVVLTPYGPELAVIGMVLVAARYNRQGLGRRLMQHALAEAHGTPVALYATEAGRPLYEELGFRTLIASTTHVGYFQPRPATTGPGRVRPATLADSAAIFRLDAQVTGTNRQAVLDQLLVFAEHWWVLEHNGVIKGYAAAWRNIGQVVMGPVIAPDAAGAQQLVAAAGKALGPAELLRLEVDARHPTLLAWVPQHGLQPTFTTSLMLHGTDALPGNRTQLFSPIMLALD